MNFYFILLSAESSTIIIIENPMSLLVPVNSTVVFTSRALCNVTCSAHWKVNDSYSLGNNFVPTPSEIGSDVTATLTVVALVSENNTEVVCEFDGIGDNGGLVNSDSATLFIILGNIRH